MASSNNIRQAMLTLLQSVPNIGLVHARERYSKSSKTLADFYVHDGVLAGGFIRRRAIRQQSPDTVAHVVWTTWEIELFRALNEGDDSELTFDQVIDEVDGVFRADQTLNGVVDGTVTEEQAGIRLITQQPAMFAGVLVHYAKLSLITEHTEF